MIREPYVIEDRPRPGPDCNAPRKQLRTTESRCVLARIQAWCVDVPCTPGCRLTEAIEYMSNRWSRATFFLEHPERRSTETPLAERALRGLVVGRKNHYGSRSRRGTEVAAVFYSLLESAKLAGIEPAAYLDSAAEAALAEPDAVPALPREMPRLARGCVVLTTRHGEVVRAVHRPPRRRVREALRVSRSTLTCSWTST